MDTQALQQIKMRFGIIGHSPKLNYAIEVAAQVAPTDLSVLITGESGSGKESFSKIIHQLSHRKHGPFIAINCGAIPEGTIDSELFGHEKGSFTGASEARKGYFEVTDGGTIFLDEIGEMPLGTQARLLRVLENREFIRVGSSKIQRTDVRVLAATNVRLLEMVEKGKFREDLYYRLNTVPIVVPPLRERGEDVELLFRKFANDFAEKYRVKPLSLLPEAREVLLRFRFPGNIRQLKNIVEQMSVLEYNRQVSGEVMARYLPDPSPAGGLMLASPADKDAQFSERDLLYKVLFDMRKDMNDLKKLVLEMAKEGNKSAPQLIAENPHLFQNVEVVKAAEPMTLPSYVYPNNAVVTPADEEVEYAKVEDEPLLDESLSLMDKEREMIVKALKKNHNKRKYAAQDLGISERTLYRKIKQYEIEE